jgi:hypothetical protein
MLIGAALPFAAAPTPALASPAGDAIFQNGFEGLGLAQIGDRALLPGESLSVQAVASPATLPALLTFSLPQAPAGAAINASGLITWSPTPSQFGTGMFTVRVQDQFGAQTEVGFRVAVLSDNTRPRLDAVPAQTVRVGQTLGLTLTATDPDAGDVLVFSRLQGPPALSVAASGALTWTPAASDVGESRVRVGVADSDGEVDVGEFSIQVERANQPPTIAAIGDRVAVVGRALQVAVVALDPDAGDSLRFEFTSAPDLATIDATAGLIAFTPAQSQIGRHRVRVVATDQLGDTASTAFDIEVVATLAEGAPIATDDRYSVVLGETLQIAAPGVLGNDRGSPGEPLVAIRGSGPGLGTLQLLGNGSFTYAPDARAVGAAATRGSSTQLILVDFESGIPSSIAPGTAGLTGVQGYAGLGPTGNTFGGSFLRGGANVPVTLTLQNLPPHTELELGFLLAIIDSWDGSGAFPGGDNFEVKLDGQTIFFESFANALPSQIQTYAPPPGVQLARRVDLAFIAGGFHTDSAYDLGADPLFARIPHSADTATITFAMRADSDQGISDESWAIDNLRVSIPRSDDQIAVDTFSYVARGGTADSAPANVRIEVLAADFAPRFISAPPATAATGLAYRYDPIVLTARSGDTLVWTLAEAPTGATVASNGQILWTPSPQQVGTHRFRLLATDPRGASGTQVFVVPASAAIVVPSVVGQSQSAATTSIVAQALTVGAVRRLASATVPAGVVLAQLPASGTPVPRSSAVALDVSSGPEPAPVPPVVGAPLSAARLALEQGGFLVGTITPATDAALPPGIVKSQSPPGARFAPTGTPVNLVVVVGPPIRFSLPNALLSAGSTSALVAEAFNDDGSPAQPQPAFVFSASAEPGLTAGAPVTVSAAVLSSGSTTRGRWRVRATRSDTGAIAEALLTVTAALPASPPFEAHERFRRLQFALAQRYRRLESAAAANDLVTLAAIRAELVADATILRADLPLLRRVSIVAPERGFFPALSAMPAAGFPETAADRNWLALIATSGARVETAARLLATLGAGSVDADLVPLLALDAQLKSGVDRLAVLVPTPYSAVSSNGETTALLSARLPRLQLAQIESLVRMLDAPNSPTASRFAGALVVAAGAASLRNRLMQELYSSSQDHVVNSGIVLGFGALLRTVIGPFEGLDVVTGASLAIHTFRAPGSSLEGSFNPIAEMNEVLMIGPDAVVAIRDLIGAFNLQDIESARDLIDKFEEIADAANGVVAAYEEANSVPDRASSGCLLTDQDCVSISWDAGFTSVNEGGNLRLPGPVLILVRDVADDRLHLTTAGFLGQPDPDED